MVKYVIRKTASWLLVIFLATNIAYLLAAVFLDPRSNYRGRRPALSEEQISQILEPHNLNPDTPLLSRWWTWFQGVFLHGDWGRSPLGESVAQEVTHRALVSAQLLLLATILSVIIGVGLGVYTAARQYKFADRFWQGVSIITMNTHVVVASIVVVSAGLFLNKVSGKRLFYVTGAANPDVHGFSRRLSISASTSYCPPSRWSSSATRATT